MNTDERGYYDALTERVLGAVFEVANTLGAGFLEKVYQRALLHELRLRGLRADAEVSFPITYKGQGVGEDFADILVEDVLVMELKCAERLSNEHTAQCLNYLRASGRTLCRLVNFQKPRVEWKRIVHGFQIPEPIEAPALAGQLFRLPSYFLDTTLAAGNKEPVSAGRRSRISVFRSLGAPTSDNPQIRLAFLA